MNGNSHLDAILIYGRHFENNNKRFCHTIYFDNTLSKYASCKISCLYHKMNYSGKKLRFSAPQYILEADMLVLYIFVNMFNL